MPRQDYERLRRLAEDFGDADAKRSLSREKIRRIYLRIDAILHVIARVEQQVQRLEGAPVLDFEPIRCHVRAGELGAAARIARHTAYAQKDERVQHELRELVGVFGCVS